MNLEMALVVFILDLFVLAGYLLLCWMTIFLVYWLSCNLEATSE